MEKSGGAGSFGGSSAAAAAGSGSGSGSSASVGAAGGEISLAVATGAPSGSTKTVMATAPSMPSRCGPKAINAVATTNACKPSDATIAAPKLRPEAEAISIGCPG
jgi:hypothetical protein